MTMTMADEMTAQHPSPEQVRRGRRMALLLFAVGFGPMILATIMFYTGWLNPGGHTNRGVLLDPVAPVSQLQLQGAGGTPLADRFGPLQSDSRWMLMVVAGSCDERCESLLYLARQVNIALGKNASRVERAAWLGSMPASLASRWQQDYGLMERLAPVGDVAPQWPDGVRPDEQPRILLVDPFGNVIMHYGSEHTGKDMLKDLKHLLKLSQIG